ncbi:MAG: hypothetical protein Q8P02_02920 [Candidatus Micrarchaeota archaeon]|nr:hypothetical protein [Candidatus Micrarchaeota archaeon]
MSREFTNAPRTAQIQHFGPILKAAIIHQAVENGVPRNTARAFAENLLKDVEPALKNQTTALQDAIRKHLAEATNVDKQRAEEQAANSVSEKMDELETLKKEHDELKKARDSKSHQEALDAIERERQEEIKLIGAAFRRAQARKR